MKRKINPFLTKRQGHFWLLLILVCFCASTKLSTQFYYVYDPGTSNLLFSDKGQLKIAAYWPTPSESNFQFGYSPLKNVVLTYARYRYEKDFFNNRSTLVKLLSADLKSSSFAIGYFIDLKQKNKRNASRPASSKSLLLDAYLGFTSTQLANTSFIRNFRSNFSYRKYYLDAGISYRTRYGGLRLNVKYAYIDYYKLMINGNALGLIDNLEQTFGSQRYFSHLELGLQLQLGIPNVKLFCDIPFMSTGSITKIPYKGFRFVNVGLVLEFNSLLKKNKYK